MQYIHERRKYPRLNKSVPLKISGDEFDIVTKTENISGAGAYCQIDRYIEPMTKLKTVILLPFQQKNKIVTKKIECSGVVVRTENTPLEERLFKIAIFFSDISQKNMQKISDYVNLHLKKESVVP